MTETERPPGRTTIAPDVLLTIARLTTLGIDGVAHMGEAPGGVNRLLRRGHLGEGVHLTIEDHAVFVDLFVVLQDDVNIHEVSLEIQNEVNRSISEMVGMEVGQINIHIEDIQYPEEA